MERRRDLLTKAHGASIPHEIPLGIARDGIPPCEDPLRMEREEHALRSSDVFLKHLEDAEHRAVQDRHGPADSAEMVFDRKSKDPSDSAHPVRERENVLKRVTRRFPQDAHRPSNFLLPIVKIITHGLA